MRWTDLIKAALNGHEFVSGRMIRFGDCSHGGMTV